MANLPACQRLIDVWPVDELNYLEQFSAQRPCDPKTLMFCPHKEARMYRNSIIRSAALAFAISLSLGAPTAFAAEQTVIPPI